MNLFFRLIFLIARNLVIRRPLGYLEEARLKFRVWITDQDAFQHMNNSRYISIADLAVIDLVMRTGVAAGMRRAGLAPVVVHRRISFYRMLRFPQAYEVVSRFTGWSGPYVAFRHDFVRDGELHAECVTIGRLVGRKGERPTVQEAIEDLGWKDVPRSPELPAPVRQQIDELERERSHRRKATA